MAALPNILKFRISARWYIRDLLEKIKIKSKLLLCPLCKYMAERSSFRIYKSRCIFGGGPLIRYECPVCEVIFGPEKFLSLPPDKVSQEYRELYFFYSEGDSYETQLEAFNKMNPKSHGVYLDYGCGKNADNIAKMRAAGYNVYGFEPYAKTQTSDFIITDKSDLIKLKFDGIYTSNVIEHLFDPLQEMQFIASLLKDDGTIAHCTPCYEYSYEFTRFHVFFYTGKSVQTICDLLSLDYLDTDNKYIKLFSKRKL